MKFNNQRSEAESKDPATVPTVMLRDSSTSLGMTRFFHHFTSA
jgi:hypothetical protein